MKKTVKNDLEPKMLDAEAPFAVREAFNQLRTNLIYTITDTADGAPVFAVTSSREHTGKSTVIANLAISFTQIDKKVLLIDADMRCPVLHDLFGFDNKRQGLSELLSGISKDVTIRGVRKNLDLITSGRIPPNPSELIACPRFSEYLDAWKKEYDIIFIDFPPIGIVTDAVVNSKAITGYIFTVRSGRSTAKKINASIEAMEKLGAKIVGVVLNDHSIKSAVYYRRGDKHGRYVKEGAKYAESAKLSAEKADKDPAKK